MERVLVTGAAGFIGSHLVDRLLSLGHRVVGVDNFDPYYARTIKEGNLGAVLGSERFTLVEGDILEPGLLDRLIADPPCDAVIHLAALAGVQPSIARPLDYQRVNIEGTVRVLEACRAPLTANRGSAPAPRLVIASSSSVYGARSAVPFSETDPCDQPASPYAATKRSTELIAYQYHHLFGLSIRLLRYFTVYGPRQRPEMAIARFCALMERGAEIVLYGDGSSSRDYTFIEDIVDGTIAAFEATTPTYRIYNLGGSRTTSLSELVALLEAALETTARVRHEPDRPGDVPITYADVRRSEAELGYRPQVPIEEGIRRYAQWLRPGR